jgi:hypothetical protein
MYLSTIYKPVASPNIATRHQRPHSDSGIQIGAQIRIQITLTEIAILRDLSIAPPESSPAPLFPIAIAAAMARPFIDAYIKQTM